MSLTIQKMIDTICLLIPKSSVINLESANQDIDNWELQQGTDKYNKYVKNPSKNNLETGNYFPRLTCYGKWFNQDATVRIEFSIPKLVYLNNLYELENIDFPDVVDILQKRLKEMGVIISKNNLENATVSTVHFSKNILLKNGYSTSYLISEINKVNLRKSFDFTRVKYTNDGQSLYAHTASHELIIYDKIADIQRSQKRAIDKDQTPFQKNILYGVKRNQLPEVIRFEVRLGRKQKMNSVLEGLGYAKNPTFKDIFSSEISQKVLNHYWQKIIRERNLGIFSLSLSNKDILQTIFTAQPNIKPKLAVYLVGLFALGKDEAGLRELRSVLCKKFTDRTWYRIVKDLQFVSKIISKNNIRDWVIQIDKGLADFKAYKQVKSYPHKEIVV